MAGFQHQYLDKYLKRLVLELNQHVALCEEFKVYLKGELQTPIPRRVTRVITPGTLLAEEFVDEDKNNFLLAIYPAAADQSSPLSEKEPNMDKKNIGLAWIDTSTGQFYVQNANRANLSSAMMRIGASEVILAPSVSLPLREEIALSLGLPSERFIDGKIFGHEGQNRWHQRCDPPLSQSLAKTISNEENVACQALFDYMDKLWIEIPFKPQSPQRKEQINTMAIDRSSIRGLELLKTARDGLTKGSVYHTIKETVTASGSRLLRERLLYPSIDKLEIDDRLDIVQCFVTDQNLHIQVVAQLRGILDVPRIAHILSMGKGDAEDMLSLANTFLKMKSLVDALRPYSAYEEPPSPALKRLLKRFVEDGPLQMCDRIKNSIDERGINELLAQGLEGEADAESTVENALKSESSIPGDDDFVPVMQASASNELAELHASLQKLLQRRKVLQDEVRLQPMLQETSLKFDAKFRYVAQVPKPKPKDKIRRQEQEESIFALGGTSVGNLKTFTMFYWESWSTLGREIDNVKREIREEERRILSDLRQAVVFNIDALRQSAAVVDELDVASSFAILAMEEGWTRPMIKKNTVHTIVGGRHPTVKVGLQEKGKSFISNDLHLDQMTRTWLITGPNMAGKSTFLRQNALITILAQMGSYVPAEYAEIGIVDKIYSRIGAADDLFRNESTFMVEMLETASILRDATERSFVIMDEVGRGTVPEDGAAVAFASLHHLYHTNKCRTLFATHFHELADQTAQWPQLAQHCTDLFEDEDGSFRFIHKLRPGVNKKSHALRVAKLAGLPQSALDVAQQTLDTLPKQPQRDLSPDR